MNLFLAIAAAVAAIFKALGVLASFLGFKRAKDAGRVEAERDALLAGNESREKRQDVESNVRRLDRAAIDERLRSKWTRN